MSSHSPTRTSPAQSSDVPTGFLDAWADLLGSAGSPTLPRRRGCKPRVPLADLLPALTYHVLSGAGTLAEHFFQLFAEPLADSSWADRRARLPWQIFTDLMQRALRPRATLDQHPDAFWRQWRLIALDGTQFSLTNTAAVLATFPKARTRRGWAAFAKITTGVLVELGLHHPLAAAIGRDGESEWVLAHRLLAQLPAGALLLADRLYGCAAFAAPALEAAARVGSHVLLRARPSTKPRVIKRLPDGSRIIQVAVRGPRGRGRIRQWVTVREIHAQVGRRGHPRHDLRLWTSLHDPQTAPARELVQLYAHRWEHELYFREVKRQLRKGPVLQSHTVETGAQEIAAIVLASALLATERMRSAAGHVPVLRVSFVKVLALVQPLWLMLGYFEDLITDRQKNLVIRRVYKDMGRCVTAKRRSRSCPRAVRQPTKRWPRLLHTQSIQGPLHVQIV